MRTHGVVRSQTKARIERHAAVMREENTKSRHVNKAKTGS